MGDTLKGEQFANILVAAEAARLAAEKIYAETETGRQHLLDAAKYGMIPTGMTVIDDNTNIHVNKYAVSFKVSPEMLQDDIYFWNLKEKEEAMKEFELSDDDKIVLELMNSRNETRALMYTVILHTRVSCYTSNYSTLGYYTKLKQVQKAVDEFIESL